MCQVEAQTTVHTPELQNKKPIIVYPITQVYPKAHFLLIPPILLCHHFAFAETKIIFKFLHIKVHTTYLVGRTP